MRSVRAAFAAILVLCASAPSTVAADPLLVETTSGLVQGIDTGDTWEWRGIPYIAPPLGELRWRAPQPPEPWDDIRDATEFASRCLQLETESELLGSEDCIYLNVFAPPVASAQPLPVMVHLHGGSNSGFWAYTDASAFVEKGVIVVTVEYRLGAFGFVGHPALSAEAGGVSGEYGLLDQIAALEWVRGNIAAFGGDPTNVTLFGESAGSFDATALVVSPLSQGLFQRAALQTESISALHGFESIASLEDLGLGMAAAVGCAEAPDVAACLRDTPADDLVFALGFIDVVPPVGGTVLPDRPIVLLAAQTETVPLLIGSNREEATIFFEHPFTGEPYSEGLYTRDTNFLVSPQAGHRVRQLYPTDAYDSPMWAAITAFSDALYTCPIRRLGLATDGPVWRYLYTHVYDNDAFIAGLRASHFLDEPFLWHNPDLLAGANYTFSASEEALSDAMATYWTNFAKTGDPNGAGLPAWPAYTADTERVLALDDPISLLEGWHVTECSFFDAVPDVFIPAHIFAHQFGPPGHIP